MAKRIAVSALLCLLAVGATPSRAEAGSIFFNSIGALGDVQLILNGTTTLNAAATGWYRESGATNQPGGTNYLAGLCSNCGPELFRDFFIFDIPAGTSVTSASLWINTFVYDSLNPTETLVLFDVSTNLVTLLAGSGGIAAYNDLGTGVSYGSRVYTAADQAQFRSVTLNAAAFSAIQSSSGGRFAMGGSLDAPVVPDPGPGPQAVPEPSTFALMFGALGVLAVRRIAQRKR